MSFLYAALPITCMPSDQGLWVQRRQFLIAGFPSKFIWGAEVWGEGCEERGCKEGGVRGGGVGEGV